MACITKIIPVGIYFVLAIIFTGCYPGPLFVLKNEINATSELWGGYALGKTYVLKHDVFIRKKSESNASQLMESAKILVPPLSLKRGGLYSAPESVDSFLNKPGNYPKVIGIVSEGTKIMCTKIIEYVPVNYRSSLYVYATLLEGPFKGAMVEISDLSKFHSKSREGIHLKGPNKFFLNE